MIQPAQTPMLRIEINPARAYVIHKGRLPKDANELMEWLNEFAEWENKRSDAIMRAYKEHMEICQRPMIIQGLIQ